MRMNICSWITGFLVVTCASYAGERTLSEHYAKAKEKCHDLSCVRKEIDQINEEILGLLTQRTAYVKRAGDLKLHTTQVALDSKRVAEIEEIIKARSLDLELPLEISLPAFRSIVENSTKFQQVYINDVLHKE